MGDLFVYLSDIGWGPILCSIGVVALFVFCIAKGGSKGGKGGKGGNGDNSSNNNNGGNSQS